MEEYYMTWSLVLILLFKNLLSNQTLGSHITHELIVWSITNYTGTTPPSVRFRRAAHQNIVIIPRRVFACLTPPNWAACVWFNTLKTWPLVNLGSVRLYSTLYETRKAECLIRSPSLVNTADCSLCDHQHTCTTFRVARHSWSSSALFKTLKSNLQQQPSTGFQR